MKLLAVSSVCLLAFTSTTNALPQFLKRATGAQFSKGQPISADGKGAALLGGTNTQIDLQNPANLGAEKTDGGVVPNLKWSLSDSRTRPVTGGWIREQTVTDLPSSHDMSAAQQHLTKGAIREMHWHRVAEWGFIYSGCLKISVVDENGKSEQEKVCYGDVWYFTKGLAHSYEGLEDDNEFILIFDGADFDKIGTTFVVDDWINHTPKDILAKNFGVNASVFDHVPNPDPFAVPGDGSTDVDDVKPSSTGLLTGDSSFLYRDFPSKAVQAPGGGGSIAKIDSTNFPISKTIAATITTIKPKGLRELHWHPNAEEWLYFHKGQARATVFIGSATARTVDLRAGDVAVFPDNSGHYIENLSDTDDLVYIEAYKSDHVADISLTQWMALTPANIVAQTLNVSTEFVEQLKKEKQIVVKG